MFIDLSVWFFKRIFITHDKSHAYDLIMSIQLMVIAEVDDLSSENAFLLYLLF